MDSVTCSRLRMASLFCTEWLNVSSIGIPIPTVWLSPGLSFRARTAFGVMVRKWETWSTCRPASLTACTVTV